jgi:hypothetical protein
VVEEEVAAAGLEAALHEVGVHGDAVEVECEERKGEVFVAWKLLELPLLASCLACGTLSR